MTAQILFLNNVDKKNKSGLINLKTQNGSEQCGPSPSIITTKTPLLELQGSSDVLLNNLLKDAKATII